MAGLKQGDCVFLHIYNIYKYIYIMVSISYYSPSKVQTKNNRIVSHIDFDCFPIEIDL